MTDENIQTPQGTEVEPTTEQPIEENADSEIERLKTKFSESSKEALRLLEENKRLAAEAEELKKKNELGNTDSTTDALYPGFETLSEVEQENLLAYTNSIKKNVRDELYKDPAIAYSKKVYAETKWNEAFNEVASEFPQIKDDADFKQKYFNAGNVPDNIKDILKDLAKVHLFDKSRDLGAQDAIEKAGRYEIERAGGGDKTPTASRSLQDWHKMAQDNPSEFAKRANEYKADLESGKLN
jgi:hypothetical protein